MKVFFFTTGDKSVASSRARVHVVAEKLQEKGFSTHVHVIEARPWWSLSPRRIKDILTHKWILFFRSRGAIVYLHKTIFQVDFILIVLAARYIFRRKIVFDFDDSQFLHSPRKIVLMVRIAHAVVVGSHFLESYAKKYNANVFLVPTVVDTSIYRKLSAAKTQKESFVIGWVGSSGHYDNLRLLKPVFMRLVASGRKFSFTIVGVKNSAKIQALFESIENLEYTIMGNLHWENPEEVMRVINTFSVGVMPLLDTPWNRGKCAYKAIEYMACGVPTVASSVGEARYLIEDGKNGFLALTDSEWFEKISRLVSNPILCSEIGSEGRKTVERFYSYQKIVPEVESVLTRVSLL